MFRSTISWSLLFPDFYTKTKIQPICFTYNNINFRYLRESCPSLSWTLLRCRPWTRRPSGWPSPRCPSTPPSWRTWCRTPPWWRSSSPARTSSWLLDSSGLLVTPVTSPAECCGGTAPASCPWPPATRLHLLQSRHTWHKSEVSKNIFDPTKYFWSNKIFLITSKYLSFSNLAHSSANVYLNTWYIQANKIHIWFKF